jgi:GNAT superfamily N-acetyltransferase
LMIQKIINKTDITIRLATASDSASLAMLRYAFRSSQDPVTESEDLFVERCSLWMQEQLDHPDRWRCWVAEDVDELVGHLWVQLIEKIPNPGSEPEHHAYITNFFVSEKCRAQGVGSMLFSAALTWIETNHVHAAILWPTERSRSFYLRHGFSVRQDLMELVTWGREKR